LTVRTHFWPTDRQGTVFDIQENPAKTLVKFLKEPSYSTMDRKRKEMERAKVTKEEIQQQDTRFLAVYVESKNSCMVMLSEREDKLGTLAIAVPKPKEGVGAVTSSVLLGDKNIISARMFAEYVASKKGKIALVSIYLEKVGE